MTKILFINGGLLLKGGTETFIMNILRHLPEDTFHIDIVVHGYGEGFYDKELESLGIRIMHVPVKGQDPIKNYRLLKGIITQGRYDVIHAHLNDQNGPVLKMAKQAGTPVRISHSHSSQSYSSNVLKQLLGLMARKKILPNSTLNLACSDSAGKYLYGDHDYTVVPNAIKTKDFIYDIKQREAIREEYGIKDEVVYGHIGWFNEIKNHHEIIRIFNGIQKQEPHSKLILVGEGPLYDDVRDQVNELGLQTKVIFAGLQDSVSEYLSAMDVFLMPSLFEGLPYVLIEAQSSGLPIYCSDTIDPNIKLTPLLNFLPLNNTDAWIEAITHRQVSTRRSYDYELKQQGYELDDFVNQMIAYYQDK